MSIAIKRHTAYAVEIEDTEGTYKAPTAATSFVQILASGESMAPAKQLLKRDIFTASIGETQPLTGEFQVKGTIPTEARASSTEGGAPEYGKLMNSGMGAVHSVTTTTTGTGNTGSVLKLSDPDANKYNVGDIIVVKEFGAYHVSPITACSRGTGTASVTLLVPRASGSFPDNVVIAATTVYTLAESGHPSLSISKYLESAVLEQAVGCKVNSVALDTFETGKIPSFKFGFEGLNFDRSLTAIPYTPSYDTSIPPIVLGGGMFMNGSILEINKMSFSMANTLAFESSVEAPNGRIASQMTARTISGTMDPYIHTDDISLFTDYKANDAFSLFAYATVPTGTAGQFGQTVAVYMPNCIITDVGQADLQGLLQDAIKFSANRGPAGTTPEMYIAFI